MIHINTEFARCLAPRVRVVPRPQDQRRRSLQAATPGGRCRKAGRSRPAAALQLHGKQPQRCCLLVSVALRAVPPFSLLVDPVPQHAEDVTHDVADRGSDQDENYRNLRLTLPPWHRESRLCASSALLACVLRSQLVHQRNPAKKRVRRSNPHIVLPDHRGNDRFGLDSIEAQVASELELRRRGIRVWA